MGIFSFLKSTPHITTTADIADQIVVYTRNIIVRQDLIKQITEKYDKSLHLDTRSRLNTSIQTYFSLEEFIARNKPLVVQRSYTKESLREEIRTKFDIYTLPIPFQLCFLPEVQQLFLLYSSYTQKLAEYIIKQVGMKGLQNLVDSITVGTKFQGLSIKDQKKLTALYRELPQVTAVELTSLFQKLNDALFQHIAGAFGENIVLDLTLQHYQYIKETYTYDLVSHYLQIIPHGILEREKLTYMTRNDLEKQAMVAAEEKLRRKLAEKSAQTLEAKLIASVSGLSLGFIMTDVTNTILIINSAAKTILKINDDTQTIKQIEEQLTNSFNFSVFIEQSKNEGAPIELREVDWNSNILRVSVSPIFIHEPAKEYIGSVILIDDITISKKLERTKDEFFAIASHELRTPLTAIRGSVSILKSHYTKEMSEGDIPTLIGFIDQSANRLIDIVNDFLNVSRIEQGRMTFNIEPFPIAELIAEVIHEINSLAEQKNIFLTFENKNRTLHLTLADRDRTKQVLVNLIGNAIKFTERGGVTVNVEEKDHYTTVRVKDTGTGISQTNQKFLFRKFKQADENILAHDSNRGTGLGLYISKKFVENMGGMIYLESSEENKGSTFVFSLPRLEPKI